jgi:hypothetical protein
MKRVYLRAVQLVLLCALAIVVSPRQARASEFACYVICIGDDWACIAKTGHPADPCTYDSQQDICNLGGCQLQPYMM